jgi:hypothetical protein
MCADAARRLVRSRVVTVGPRARFPASGLLALATLAACGGGAARPREGRSIGNVAADRVVIGLLSATRGEHAAVGAALRTGVTLALAAAREDGSPRPEVQSIEVVAGDAGDGSSDEARRAAAILAGRADVVAVIVARTTRPGWSTRRSPPPTARTIRRRSSARSAPCATCRRCPGRSTSTTAAPRRAR